jgi:hypothetical protein
MAMYIVKPWYRKKNPDDYFDPVTHIATEENFIKFLECGVYDSKYIGYKVQLSNTATYNNGLWVIADVNHDSANTRQRNCYDLISQDCFYSTAFGSDQNWRNSSPRTYLNGTFYNGFSSAFKAHILNPKYKSQSTWYTDDYVILPSYKEVNGESTSYADNEGIAYPIFTDNSSRIKYRSGTSTASSWWTRSRRPSTNVWFVRSNGSMYNNYYSSSNYIAPLLRIS